MQQSEKKVHISFLAKLFEELVRAFSDLMGGN